MRASSENNWIGETYCLHGSKGSRWSLGGSQEVLIRKWRQQLPQREAIEESEARIHTCTDLTELRISILYSLWEFLGVRSCRIEDCCKNSGSCRTAGFETLCLFGISGQNSASYGCVSFQRHDRTATASSPLHHLCRISLFGECYN